MFIGQKNWFDLWVFAASNAAVRIGITPVPFDKLRASHRGYLNVAEVGILLPGEVKVLIKIWSKSGGTP